MLNSRATPAVLEEPVRNFEERTRRGRDARERVPRALHGQWSAADDRPDPIGLLELQAKSRVPELLPIRYGRMAISPLTFYRGSAAIMAADLASAPVSGITVQLCGDAHLSNFGVFGSPERTVVFDINDFDETLPGPWEWDVMRLAASFEIAGRCRGFTAKQCHDIVIGVVHGYRAQMQQAASAGVLDAWYDRVEADLVIQWMRDERKAHKLTRKQIDRAGEGLAKARTRDSVGSFRKLVEVRDGQTRFKSDPPLLEPIEDLAPDRASQDRIEHAMQGLLESYQKTLINRPHPGGEYSYVHMARKVVGVGSVGTRAWVALLTGRSESDPLILQAKEAQASVLEPYLGASRYRHNGKRVVMGQRRMQASSDIFLGWQRAKGIDSVPRDYYIRQLHDWKGSVDVDNVSVAGAELYGRVCGGTLARAHARTGDRVAIATYLGRGDQFDRAIAQFASTYAGQNDEDYNALLAAIASGRLQALHGI
jgi:uncharacterized protein (DUF2252 family)